MKNNKVLKRIIYCLVVVVLLGLVMTYLTNTMERKASNNKYNDFFEQEEDFDVLFMGSSHMMDDVYPMELWNDYGIVSYNFGGDGNVLPTTYWVMMNALEYTNPKVMVIDCKSLNADMKTFTDYSFVHLSLDTFPLNRQKIAAIRDLLDDPKAAEDRPGEEKREPIGLLWDYSVYHSRWTEVNEDDYYLKPNVQKGAEAVIALGYASEVEKISRDQKLEGDTWSVIYLKKMIEECQSRGIDVVLTYLPYPAWAEEQMDANRVYDIADEYGVDYLNFLDMDVVNYASDCYDANSHLNPSGAYKVTDYLGQYIMDNFNVADQRENPEYASWNDDYKEYEDFKLQNLKDQQALENYLILLKDKNLDSVIEVNHSLLWSSKRYRAVLENLGVNLDEVTDDTDFVVVQAGGKATTILNNFHVSGATAETCLGTLTFKTDGDEPFEIGAGPAYHVYLGNNELYSLTPDQNAGCDLRAVAIITGSNTVIDNASFSVTVCTGPSGYGDPDDCYYTPAAASHL